MPTAADEFQCYRGWAHRRKKKDSTKMNCYTLLLASRKYLIWARNGMNFNSSVFSQRVLAFLNSFCFMTWGTAHQPQPLYTIGCLPAVWVLILNVVSLVSQALPPGHSDRWLFWQPVMVSGLKIRCLQPCQGRKTGETCSGDLTLCLGGRVCWRSGRVLHKYVFEFGMKS